MRFFRTLRKTENWFFMALVSMKISDTRPFFNPPRFPILPILPFLWEKSEHPLFSGKFPKLSYL